jgi:hypothetical protein
VVVMSSGQQQGGCHRAGRRRGPDGRCCVSGKVGTVDHGLCGVQMARASSVKTAGSR